MCNKYFTIQRHVYTRSPSQSREAGHRSGRCPVARRVEQLMSWKLKKLAVESQLHTM